MPFALIPFLLLVVPVVEIAAFILIGGQIGIGPTLLMILVTAIVGTFLLRQQGFQLLNKIREETAAGRIPGRTLGDGAMVLVAGILLLTPGFVTDTIGFLLFVPFVRSGIWKFLASRISVVVPGGGGTFGEGRTANDPFTGDPFRRKPFDDETVIDLEESEYSVENEDTKPDPKSPWRGE